MSDNHRDKPRGILQRVLIKGVKIWVSSFNFHELIAGTSKKEGRANPILPSFFYGIPGTVKVHLHNICEKLHLKGRLALLHYAREKGLI